MLGSCQGKRRDAVSLVHRRGEDFNDSVWPSPFRFFQVSFVVEFDVEDTIKYSCRSSALTEEIGLDDLLQLSNLFGPLSPLFFQRARVIESGWGERPRGR